MKARTLFASFQKSYPGGIVYQFAKRVDFLSCVTAFAELMYNPISLSLQTADNRVWIDLKYPHLRLWWCHWQGRRRSGTAGDAVKELSAMETYKNKKISLSMCLGARIAAIIFFQVVV